VKAALGVSLLAAVWAQAQGPPAFGGRAPVTPRAAAPIDLTGYWVSQITEDWRYRMMTAPEGDAGGVPLNPEGRKVAAAWDPGKDEAAGELCKAYGAAGLLRLPLRLHITWESDSILKLESDAGQQIRRLSFGAPQGREGDPQGLSAASWDRPGSPMGFAFMLGGGGGPGGGSLKVVTTKMKAGYIHKNGIPYSANAAITEYFDRFDVPGGDSLLVVSSEMTDPTYLAQPYWTSVHFKKQAGGAGWNPTPCSAR